MSSSQAEPSNSYLETLLQYYEEEISGEACFYALAEHFAEREKITLLARIERDAAQAVEPLLQIYGLKPRQPCPIKSISGLIRVAVPRSW